jgi:hypothetical protein
MIDEVIDEYHSATILKGSARIKLTEADGLYLFSHTVLVGGPSGYLTTYDGELYASSSLFYDYFSLAVRLDLADRTVHLTLNPKSNDIMIETVRYSVSKSNDSVLISYPKVSGLSNPTAQERINAVLTECVGLVTDEADGDVVDTTWQLEGYIVLYNENGLLSIAQCGYAYYGGAHGMEYALTHTFDLSTGKELSLLDLLKDKGKATAYFNTVIRDRFKRMEGSLPFDSIREDQPYYLSSNGLVILFGVGEYTGYAAGIQQFLFPYEDLKPYLKPEVRFQLNT